MVEEEFIEEHTLGSIHSDLDLDLDPDADIDIFQKHDKLINLCFNCKTRVPQLILLKRGFSVIVQVKFHYCKYGADYVLSDYNNELKSNFFWPRKYCELKKDHRLFPAFKYVLREQKYACKSCIEDCQRCSLNQILLPTKIDIEGKCKLHSKKFKFICKNCHLEVCKLCKNTSLHNNHLIIDIESNTKEYNETFNFDIQNKMINDKNGKNRILFNELIRLLSLKIQELTKLKSDLEEVYSIHRKNNEQLFEFKLKNRITYDTLARFPIPEIVPNVINNCILNKEELDIDLSDLESSSIKAIQYFTNNTVFQLTKQTNSTTQKEAHLNSITCIIELNDGRLATGSSDTKIKLWKIDDLKAQLQELLGHKSSVSALIQFQSNNLVSGSEDKTIRMWNISNGQVIKTLEYHTNVVYCLLKLRNTNRFISSSADETIVLYDTSTGIINITKEESLVLIQLSDDSIVTTKNSTTLTIQTMGLSSLETIKTLKGHKRRINVVYELANTNLISGAFDELFIWDMINYTLKTKIFNTYNSGFIVNTITQLIDRTVVIASLNTFRCYDLTTNQFVFSSNQHTDVISSIIELKDRSIVSCSWDKSFIIWQYS